MTLEWWIRVMTRLSRHTERTPPCVTLTRALDLGDVMRPCGSVQCDKRHHLLAMVGVGVGADWGAGETSTFCCESNPKSPQNKAFFFLRLFKEYCTLLQLLLIFSLHNTRKSPISFKIFILPSDCFSPLFSILVFPSNTSHTY